MHDIHCVNTANSHKVAGHPKRVQDWCLTLDEIDLIE